MSTEAPGDAFDFKTTFVDRRQCKRVVPMKVLVLGMSRTGTLSIRGALKRLGYTDVYHGFNLLWGNRQDIDLWKEALEAKFEGKGKPYTKEDWDRLLGHCQAVTDAPCMIFAKELIEAYPEAKVILTTRDPEKWHASVASTLSPDWRKSRPGLWWREPLCNIIPNFKSRREGFQKVLKYSLGEDFEQNGQKHYEEHNEYVRSLVPKERLLEYQVAEGWGPLCDFLNEPVPDTEFPRGNDTKGTQKRLDELNDFALLIASVLWLSLFGFVGMTAYGLRQAGAPWGLI